jgi:hypothetical protein
LCAAHQSLRSVRAGKHRGHASGERFVPGYKPVSMVDLLMNAPFDA